MESVCVYSDMLTVDGMRLLLFLPGVDQVGEDCRGPLASGEDIPCCLLPDLWGKTGNPTYYWWD